MTNVHLFPLLVIPTVFWHCNRPYCCERHSQRKDTRIYFRRLRKKNDNFVQKVLKVRGSKICWKQTLWSSRVSGEGHHGSTLCSHNPLCLWGFKATATEIWGCIQEVWRSLLKEERKAFLVIMGWKWKRDLIIKCNIHQYYFWNESLYCTFDIKEHKTSLKGWQRWGGIKWEKTETDGHFICNEYRTSSLKSG